MSTQPGERIATLEDGTRIVLPDDLGTMTTFVVEEQRDWFEQELPFVRSLLEPGDRVVDIGANFGLYALSMARRVGPEGSVLAFEPTPTTAAFLRKSVEANAAGWVRVEEVALADEPGELSLSVGPSPELNQLTFDAPAGAGATVTVKVDTLARYGADLAGRVFVKLDAEGAEERIVRGAAGYFEREDPVVMFELKHGSRLNTSLLEVFESRGYALYALVPGLSALAPFDRSHIDPKLLNVFAVKRGRAELLARRGKLALGTAADVEVDRGPANAYWAGARHRGLVRGRDLPLSMAFWAMAKSAADVEVRYRAMEKAFAAAKKDVETRPSFPRRLTFARIAFDAGRPAQAVGELIEVLRAFDPDSETLEGPFLPVLPRWDEIDPGPKVGPFVAAQALAAVAKLRSFSGFFEGPDQLALLESFAAWGFPDPEMERRLSMARARFGNVVVRRADA
jgi:FkbM family methyltransferase